MSAFPALVVERWTPESRVALAVAALAAVLLAFGPLWLGANSVDRLTTLFIYVILAVMWNALVGYCGLVSIGQQAFFGLGAYFAVRLADSGVGVYPSLFLAAIVVGALSLPLSAMMLRLKGGEFAIGMWVIAELAHLLVNLDTLINGETGAVIMPSRWISVTSISSTPARKRVRAVSTIPASVVTVHPRVATLPSMPSRATMIFDGSYVRSTSESKTGSSRAIVPTTIFAAPAAKAFRIAA